MISFVFSSGCIFFFFGLYLFCHYYDLLFPQLSKIIFTVVENYFYNCQKIFPQLWKNFMIIVFNKIDQSEEKE